MTKFEFQPFDKVLVRMDNVSVWEPAFFGRLDTDDKHTWRKYITTANIGRAQCIPYNETTKHLIGTTDPYVEPEELPVFEFGDVVQYRDLEINALFLENLGENTSKVIFPVWSGPSNVYTSQLTLIRKGNFNRV